MAEPQLTVLNVYRLNGSVAQFEAAISALVARVRAEGHRGVLSYRFFGNATENLARAVIDYETPDAWIGHHDISMGWPEMRALHATATLSEVTFLGPLTPHIKNWIESSALTAQVKDGNVFVAGFRR